MERIKLKDYKGEYVCIEKEGGFFNFIETTNVDEIKKYKNRNIYGSFYRKVFDEESTNNMLKSAIKTVAFNGGFNGMEDLIDFESKEWEDVKKAVNNFIDSMGEINDGYYVDENILIEID